MIAFLNCSSDVNAVCKGSSSRIFNVRLISLGITILPKSSTPRTISVAVPGVLLADGAAASLTDRGHSLYSLFLPPAAVVSLPCCFHISFSFSAARPKAPLVRGAVSRTGWLRGSHSLPQSASQPAPSSEGAFSRAYNNFTNYAVSICKGTKIIPHNLLFRITMIW